MSLSKRLINTGGAPAGNGLFQVITWNGDGVNGRDINSLSFAPDLIWIKATNTTDNSVLCNILEGPNKKLSFNDQSKTGGTDYGVVTSFNSYGFTLGGTIDLSEVNAIGTQYVAFCWKGGGAGVQDTNGYITTTVSSNSESGFSVNKYIGVGGSRTIGHGLFEAPRFMFGTAYYPGFRMPTQIFDVLNRVYWINEKSNTTATVFGNVAPTSTTYIGANGYSNFSGYNHSFFFFTSIPNFSKVDKYTGTGAAGNTVTLGFKPAWIIIKYIRPNFNFDDSWYIEYTGSNGYIKNDTTTGLEGTRITTFTEDGFTLNSAFQNGLDNEYFYYAISE